MEFAERHTHRPLCASQMFKGYIGKSTDCTRPNPDICDPSPSSTNRPAVCPIAVPEREFAPARTRRSQHG
jgi:hypothetical protein